MIIAKQQTTTPSNDYFELFQPTKGLDINGDEIDILQSIGSYSIMDLQNQKASFENEIKKINEKITAIEALS